MNDWKLINDSIDDLYNHIKKEYGLRLTSKDIEEGGAVSEIFWKLSLELGKSYRKGFKKKIHDIFGIVDED